MHHAISTSQILTTYHACRLALTPQSSLSVSAEAAQKIANCRAYLDHKITNTHARYYGINTGFGALYNVAVSDEDLKLLQQNLLVSHACGAGAEVPPEIVRLMLLLKIQSLSYGRSGVQPATVERLVYFFNNHLLPVVYEQGSLGASGDLAPLSHLSLPLIGLGTVYFEGKKQTATQVLQQLNLAPIWLQPKEGLALINGTQFMAAYAVWCVQQAITLAACADLIAAVSFDAFDGHTHALHPLIHQIRQQLGQIQSAQNLSRYLEGSKIAQQPKQHVQDPYSFRCAPQVHGASLDAINHVNQIITREINAVTDNPLLFEAEDLIVSGGNFHGQPLALALDYLAIAMAELGSISERRTYTLLGGQRQLPPFLAQEPGLHSGLMIPQYTAAALVSQNKQLCTPASVDSIPSSNGQEDHVSMGANAATKCYKVVQNLTHILAIELLTAAQALDFRKKTASPALKSSPIIEKLLQHYRTFVPFNSHDRLLHTDIAQSLMFVKEIMPQYVQEQPDMA